MLTVSLLSLDQPSEWQVLKLQSKWVLQIVLRILSQNQSYEAAIAAMKAFLPLDLKIGDIVLSIDLAVALETLHDLVHTTQSNMKANLPEVLEKATQHLTTKTLQSYHKPITRVGSMTHFKRLLKEGHQLVVNAKLDKEADEKAMLVRGNLKKVTDFVPVLDSHANETFDFSIVASVLQD